MDVFGIFISPFIQAMVDKLSSYFNNLVSTADVGAGIQNLKKALEDLETLLADAENKQPDRKDIKKWLEEVYHLAYDADDLLDDFATEALERKLMAEETTMGRRSAKFPRLSSIVPFNLKNGSKLNEITSQLQEVAAKGKDLGLDKRLVGRMSTDLRQRSQTTCLEEPQIHGRAEDIKQIIELLLGDAPTGKNFDVIPIGSKGGMGKYDDSSEWRERGLEDEFEPIILSEKYMTEKDDRIREIDLPERMQISEESTGPPPTDETSIEEQSNWIYNQLLTGMIPLFSERVTETTQGERELSINKDDIMRFLEFMHVQKLDVIIDFELRKRERG